MLVLRIGIASKAWMFQEGWVQSVLAIHVSAGIFCQNPEVHVPVHSPGGRIDQHWHWYSGAPCFGALGFVGRVESSEALQRARES